MRITTSIGKWLLGVLLCSTGFGVVAPAIISRAQDAAPVLIANTSIPDHPISKTEVQNIFLGKVTKIDDIKVTFVILKSGDVHADFLETYLSRTPAQYSQYWKKLVFSGKGKSPKAFENEAELLEYLTQTPGAIGYIGAAAADTLTDEHLRLVTVR